MPPLAARAATPSLRHGRRSPRAAHRNRGQRAAFGHLRGRAQLEEARAAVAALIRGRRDVDGRRARRVSRAQPFRALFRRVPRAQVAAELSAAPDCALHEHLRRALPRRLRRALAAAQEFNEIARLVRRLPKRAFQCLARAARAGGCCERSTQSARGALCGGAAQRRPRQLARRAPPAPRWLEDVSRARAGRARYLAVARAAVAPPT